MSEDIEAAARHLLNEAEMHLLEYEDDDLMTLDMQAVARYALEAADRQAALAAELGRVKAIETLLRQRVWKLRPALAAAVRALRDVLPYFEDSHEGGEIGRIVATGERALTETAGSTTSTADALNTAPAVAGEAKEAGSETDDLFWCRFGCTTSAACPHCNCSACLMGTGIEPPPWEQRRRDRIRAQRVVVPGADELERLREALQDELASLIGDITILTAGLPPDVAAKYRNDERIERIRRALGIRDALDTATAVAPGEGE
jgi:hypothetical protein